MASELDQQTLIRLDRIESKIDSMTQALIAIARAEEKIAVMEADREAQRRRDDLQEKKLARLTQSVSDMTAEMTAAQRTYTLYSRIVLAIGTPVVAGIINHFFKIIPFGG